METSLYKINFKDGRTFNIFCANRKQNKDMLHFLSSEKGLREVKRHGAVVVASGIHTMTQFRKIIDKTHEDERCAFCGKIPDQFGRCKCCNKDAFQ